jgi:hypothetical protein
MSVFKAVIKHLITLIFYVFIAMKIYIVVLSVMTPSFWRYITASAFRAEDGGSKFL